VFPEWRIESEGRSPCPELALVFGLKTLPGELPSTRTNDIATIILHPAEASALAWMTQVRTVIARFRNQAPFCAVLFVSFLIKPPRYDFA
jgi:hypothetical protein